MDEGLPPFIRDSYWFMYPFFRFWFKNKNLKTYMDFKKIAWSLSNEEFDTIYSELDCRATDRPSDLNNASVEYMLKKIDTSSKNLLDVGCGRGYWLSLLQKKTTLELAGCDVFESAPIPSIKYSKGNIEALPFADNAFDIVTCHHTIEHIRDIKKAVSELKRVTKKQLIIVTPKQRYYYYTLDLHLHFFPFKESLLSLFEVKNAECIEYDGDWCLLINFT